MSEQARGLFRPGANCWRIERADRLSVVVDADAYFSAARSAMLKARRRIIMVGWDFDARVDLDRTAKDVDGPRDLGHFLPWLVERTPELEVYLLRWDTGTIKSILSHGTIRATFRWIRSPRIHIRLDGHHPTAASHHQKILVIDDEMAFCGGIDMLADRWDTREHIDEDPRRALPGKAPFKPWHDATTCLSGPAARALAELCRERWRRSGADPLEAIGDVAHDCWPEALPVDFRDVPVAISRTIPTMDDQEPEHEIEALTLDLIASAKRHIYAESQYFASRKIARAIARRLEESDGPEIVVVNPTSAQGLVEPIAMDSARARLVQALRACDHDHRFRLYHALTTARTPIYTHAKILVVDDVILKLGSSNMNNRSMRLDTECDVTIDARDGLEAHGRCILAIRDGLIAEHLGVSIEEVRRRLEANGSLVATIEDLRRRSGRTLQPYEVPDLSAVEVWLADNEVLDPEGPDEMFEPPSESRLVRARTGLLNRLLAR